MDPQCNKSLLVVRVTVLMCISWSVSVHQMKSTQKWFLALCSLTYLFYYDKTPIRKYTKITFISSGCRPRCVLVVDVIKNVWIRIYCWVFSRPLVLLLLSTSFPYTLLVKCRSHILCISVFLVRYCEDIHGATLAGSPFFPLRPRRGFFAVGDSELSGHCYG